MNNIQSKLRFGTVQHYLRSGDSLRKTAQKFHVSYRTVFKWVKLYKEQGEEGLLLIYRRPWNRPPKQIEEQIVLLKQNDPCLTLFKAKNILKKRGIKISIKGIWCIWKRYNLADFSKNGNPFIRDGKTSPEVQDGLKKAEQALNEGGSKKAARILNALPSCSNKDILSKIPDGLLCLHRKVEKLSLTFGEILFQETLRKARRLREQAEKKSLFYTALRASIIELFAMDWTGKHYEQLALVQRLKKQMVKKNESRNSNDLSLHFNLLILEGRAFAGLGRIEEALFGIRKCEVLCRINSNSLFCIHIASLCSVIGFHKKARRWLEKSLKIDKNRQYTHEMLAANMAMAGEYNSAIKILKKLRKENAKMTTLSIIVNALCSLGEGRIDEATRFANQALDSAKREAIPVYLWASSSILAFCLCGLGEGRKAKKLIKRVALQFKNFKIKRNDYLAHVLLGQNCLPQDAILRPDVKIAVLLSRASKSLRIKDYRKAYNYTNTHQLMGLFHRLALFFPEPVNKLITKGKPTGLPRVLLKLPVFQKHIPVYHLRFLGFVRVYRNNMQLDSLTPMHTSFLIHLSFKKKVELEAAYGNFWHNAKNPRASLSHLLYGLRKYLKLLPNTLFIKGGFLNFKGYITTDYQYYEETITRARALERVDKWSFAKKEYLRAFALFRGEPFKKMYDNWSEHMRRVILNRLETEAIHFAKSCLERGNKKDAKRVLEKVSKIIPQSEEIRSMVSECGSNGVPEKQR